MKLPPVWGLVWLLLSAPLTGGAEDNRIYAWGNGNSGQLGCGEAVTQWAPVEIHLCPGEKQRPVVRGISTGGRHTFLWLANGHMYSWGNNYYAQLGYDMRTPNYKENKLIPHLLEALTYRPVVHISCGEKHTLILFQHGVVAVVGNNSHGQVGDGGRAESVLPKTVDELPPVTHIAAGSNHNVVLTDTGGVYVWGYGRGCGVARGDVLEPLYVPLRSRSAPLQVSAGQAHSLLLTDSGAVYSLGDGSVGQLGHGDKLVFCQTPRRLRSRHLPRPVTQVCCGESYSVAVTASGGLYMWGKDSHVMGTGEASHRVYTPRRVNTTSRPVSRVACGSWHAAAILGRPEWRGRGPDADAGGAVSARTQGPRTGATAAAASGEGLEEQEVDGVVADRCTQTSRLSWQSRRVFIKGAESETSSSDDDSIDDILEASYMPHHSGQTAGKPFGGISRTLTLAEFYAPSPSPQLLRRPGGLFRRPDTMEVVSLNNKKPLQTEKPSSNGFCETGEASSSEWRPAYPSGGPASNGLIETADTVDALPRGREAQGMSSAGGPISLTASRTSISEPSMVLGVQGLGSQSRDNGLASGSLVSNSKEDGFGGAGGGGGGTYTSTGINQGVVQLSKSRSADFLLPREKSSLHSQNLDVSAVPAAQDTAHNPSPRHRFHIDQHVAVHVRTGSSNSSKGSSSGSSVANGSSGQGQEQKVSPQRTPRIQASHVAFRRAKTVYGMQGSSTAHKAQPNDSVATVSMAKALSKDPQEYAFMIPRTVTFIASDGECDPGTPGSKKSTRRAGGSQDLGLKAENHRAAQGAGSPSTTGAPSKGSGANRSRTMGRGVQPVVSPEEGALPPHTGVRNKATLNLYMRPTKNTRLNRPSRR